MFKKKTCEIVMVLDRSGSMSSCKQETIESINKFISDQQKVAGHANLSIVLFDHEYKVHHCGVDLRDIGYINETQYVPRGMTALYDAIGRAISSTQARLAARPPDQVIFVIVTDGLENASKEFTQTQVADLVAKEPSWKFVFLGANQDAVLIGKGLRLDEKLVCTHDATSKGVRAAYLCASGAVAGMRSGEEMTSGGLTEMYASALANDGA